MIRSPVRYARWRNHQLSGSRRTPAVHRQDVAIRRAYPGRVRSCSGWHAPGWAIVRPQGSWLPSTLCGHLSRSSHPPSAFSSAAAIRARIALSACSSYAPGTVASLCCDVAAYTSHQCSPVENSCLALQIGQSGTYASRAGLACPPGQLRSSSRRQPVPRGTREAGCQALHVSRPSRSASAARS